MDAVLTEDDAFDNVKVLRTGLGRIHRSWVATRQIFDPGFKDPRKTRTKE